MDHFWASQVTNPAARGTGVFFPIPPTIILFFSLLLVVLLVVGKKVLLISCAHFS